MADRIEILTAEQAGPDVLAAFFRSTWDSTATAERVALSRQQSASSNSCEPGIAPPTYVAVQSGRVLGYCSSLPLRLWVGGQEHPAYCAKGLMVLPEFRGGPIGYHVLKALTAARPVMAANPVATEAKRLFGALGYRNLGAIPDLVRPTSLRLALTQLRPLILPVSGSTFRVALGIAEVARRSGLPAVAGGAADLLLRPFITTRSALGTSVQEESDISPGELDELWADVRDSLGAVPIRDSRTLANRYLARQSIGYHAVTLRREGRLQGIAILKAPRAKGDPRLAGVRMASISDLVVRPDDQDLSALLNKTEECAARLGAGAVILSVTNRRVVEVARRRGYAERAGTVHFLLRTPDRFSSWPSSLSDWWVTRGDGDADGNF